MMDFLFILKLLWMWVTRRVTYAQFKKGAAGVLQGVKEIILEILFLGFLYGISSLVVIILLDFLLSL
jgi:hypothetical protein